MDENLTFAWLIFIASRVLLVKAKIAQLGLTAAFRRLILITVKKMKALTGNIAPDTLTI